MSPSLGAQTQSASQSFDFSDKRAVIAYLAPYLWPKGRGDLRLQVVLAMVAMVMGKLLTVLIPFTYKWATNALGVNITQQTDIWLMFASIPVILVVAYGVARFVSNAFNQLRDALFAAVGQHAVRGLANHVFSHMHELSLRFHLKRRTGGLSRVIERGKAGIETIIRLTMMIAIPTLIEFILTAYVLAIQFNGLYVLIVATTVVLYVWFSVWASNQRIKIRQEMNEADTDAMSKAIDSLLNFETVKYFNNEDLEKTRFDRATKAYEGAAIKTYTSLAWLNFGQGLIFSLGMAIVMVMSALEVINGQKTIGHFVMVNAFMIQLSIPLNFIGTLYREITVSLVDMESMFTLLGEKREVVDDKDAKPIAIKEGAIRFDNVVFGYDPDRLILKGVSFEIPAGKTVAVVGPSGAGKSTLSRLLFRFYDVQSGSITVDGQDIRSVTQESLRRQIGMVPQDTVLFNDTIGYNIGYGRAGASQEEIEKAAHQAQIAAFIESLPKGYGSEVGERGLKLSGGEKQRVAIARTLLKAPPILILDEATSALDTHTERDIQSALDAVSQNRTTLVIAHRLSTIVGADEIIVLKDGKIAERGKHDDLLAQKGLYCDLWERQKMVDEAKETLKKIETVNN